MREIFAVFGVNGNELARIQRCRQLFQFLYRRVAAGVRVHEIYARVCPIGGNSVTADVLRMVAVKVAEPLRVDHVDGGGSVLKLIDETEARHLAEVEECFRSLPQVLRHHPSAKEPVAKVAEVIRVGLQSLILTTFCVNSNLLPFQTGRTAADHLNLLEYPCGVNVDDQ